MNLLGAIKLLGTYTAGRFDIWMLAGSSKASCRAHIMSVLHGTRIPQAKSGVNALRSALYTEAKIDGECEAHRQDNFLAYCKQVVS
jgi:hypothetical protein